MKVLTVAGSPSKNSRSTKLLNYIEALLINRGFEASEIRLSDISSDALINADFSHKDIQSLQSKVLEADLVIFSTPVYQASYSGGLKTIIDLFPEKSLSEKLVFAIATGGSPAHMLVLEYALQPVLSALGAKNYLNGIFATNADMPINTNNEYELSDQLRARLDLAIQEIEKKFNLNISDINLNNQNPGRRLIPDANLAWA